MTEAEEHPSNSIGGYIAGLTILAKYMKKGMKTTYFCGGEHDIIHIYVDTDTLPEDSEDGRLLISWGFHTNEDGWAFFT